MFTKLILMIWVFTALPLHAKQAVTLDQLLSLAYKNNPSIQQHEYEWSAEDSLVTSMASFEDPMIGVSELNRGSKTQYATVLQKIKFPIKYFYQAKAQKSKANSFRSKLKATKLIVREKVISLYYAIYSTQKIIELTNANMESVKEFARVAEKKYAAGKSTQSDSMKAHFELTKLELELIQLRQQEEALQYKLSAFINHPSLKKLKLSQIELDPPKFFKEKIQTAQSNLLEQVELQSPVLKAQTHQLKAANYKSSLAKWAFAPDFQVQYQQRLSGQPEDSNILSVGITVPLWFWKKSSEASTAFAKKLAQEYKVKNTSLQLVSRIKDLKGQVNTLVKTLKVYQTSLIPQAQGTYNSSRSAYQANKTSFLDLLDSERSLYKVKTDYYKSLKQYVATLSHLESQLGFTVSNLSAINEVQNEK